MKKIQFIHCADLHLGNNNPEEETYFRNIANYALKSKVDFLIITGDLFNANLIESKLYDECLKILSILKNSNIDVIMIEGNHDQLTDKLDKSILYSLSKKGYIKLLHTKFEGDKPILTKWDPISNIGSYIDYKDIRILGIGYLFGASLKNKIKYLASDLKNNKFNLLMLHIGVHPTLSPEFAGIKKEEIECLKEKINYLALGHIHYKYEIDNWIFNPGALTASKKTSNKKGFFHVIINENNTQEVTFKENKLIIP
jgi:DNA repair protein SbcD/Mre11